MGKLIIDGNAVYEIDECCMEKKKKRKEQNKKSSGAAGSAKTGGNAQFSLKE